MILRALAHRNFRLFFGGQTISLLGTWMQQTAMTWLVYRLTNSPFWLGLVNFAGQIPTFFLAPLGGVLTDRYDRQRMLLVTQTLALVQAFLLAILTLTGQIAVWHIILLSAFLGVVNAFDITIRQAFLMDMLDNREDLGNAIALNSSMVNGTRLLGPSLAGFLIVALGEGLCFLLNSISYIAVLIALLAMRMKPRPHPAVDGHLWLGLKEGFTYAFGFPPIRALLLLLALVSFLGVPYSVLLPVFATNVLGGGADTLGLLLAAPGLGALAAALYLASRKTILGLGKRIAWAPSLLGLGIVAFSFSDVLWLSLGVLFVAGFALMVQMASSNTVLQTIVEDDKRGRVMSFYTMAFMGMVPLGSLFAGSLASWIGAPATLQIGGLACIAGSLVFASRLPRWRELVRPIYQRLGILPAMATGIQAATELTVPPED